jgi:hypothetical protein
LVSQFIPIVQIPIFSNSIHLQWKVAWGCHTQFWKRTKDRPSLIWFGDFWEHLNVIIICTKISLICTIGINWLTNMVQKRFPRYGVPIWSLWPNIRSLPSIVAEKNVTKNGHIQNVCSMCPLSVVVSKKFLFSVIASIFNGRWHGVVTHNFERGPKIVPV